MALTIQSLAYGKRKDIMSYNPQWDSATPSEKSSTQLATVGPNVSVATFIETVLKAHLHVKPTSDLVGMHSMVVNDQKVFPSSKQTLGKVLGQCGMSSTLCLNVTSTKMSVTIKVNGVNKGVHNLYITQTLGQAKEELKEKLDLTGYQVKCGPRVLTDGSQLAFVHPGMSPAPPIFDCFTAIGIAANAA